MGLYSKEVIQEKVYKAIVESSLLSKDEIELTSNFTEDLGLDFLDAVELLMALEEEFDIEINDEDAEKLKTVTDAIEYINNKLN